MHHRPLFVAVAAVLAVACGGNGDPVSVGENQPSKTGELLSDYAASWDGYVEAYAFPPGTSDRVRLTLDEYGTGTLQVGDTPLLDPPTDPEVAYADLGGDALGDGRPGWIHVGFEYTVQAASVSGARIRLSVANTEIYTAWCGLQTPGAGLESCALVQQNSWQRDQVTGICSTYDGGDLVPVDCGKCTLCFTGICQCDTESCATSTNANEHTSLDAALEQDGDQLVGTLSLGTVDARGAPGEHYTVRLERQ